MEYGSTVQIQATVYASSQNDLVIVWYHEGIVVNQSENGHISLIKESQYIYALSISSVDSSHLGQYEAVVILGAKNTSDTVQLVLPGKDNVNKYVGMQHSATTLHFSLVNPISCQARCAVDHLNICPILIF